MALPRNQVAIRDLFKVTPDNAGNPRLLKLSYFITLTPTCVRIRSISPRTLSRSAIVFHPLDGL
jgi:hypothetical protein